MRSRRIRAAGNWAEAVIAAYEITGCAADGGHAGGIAMSAHICLDEGGTAHADDLSDSGL